MHRPFQSITDKELIHAISFIDREEKTLEWAQLKLEFSARVSERDSTIQAGSAFGAIYLAYAFYGMLESASANNVQRFSGQNFLIVVLLSAFIGPVFYLIAQYGHRSVIEAAKAQDGGMLIRGYRPGFVFTYKDYKFLKARVTMDEAPELMAYLRPASKDSHFSLRYNLIGTGVIAVFVLLFLYWLLFN